MLSTCGLNSRSADWLGAITSVLAVALCHLLQDLVDPEARGLLSWRVILKRRREFLDDGLRPQKRVVVVEVPVPIGARGDVRPSKWVGAQVPDPRYARMDKGTPHSARVP